MSASLNKVLLIGRLGNDVNLHKFDDGNSVANFSLATSEAYKKADGELVEKTEWHKIAARNKLAEICEKYLHKGDLVFVEGKLHTNKWEQDGESRYSTEVHIWKVEFLSKKNAEPKVDWVTSEEELPQ